MNRLKQAWLALCVVALAGCGVDYNCRAAARTYSRAQDVADACEASQRCVMTAAEYEALMIHRETAETCGPDYIQPKPKVAKGNRK